MLLDRRSLVGDSADLGAPRRDETSDRDLSQREWYGYAEGPDAGHAHGRRLIVVSNRGPVEHSFVGAGAEQRIEARQGAGGVVSGLLCALQERPVTWIALAMNEADRQVARAHSGGRIPAPRQLSRNANMTLRLVDAPERAYTRYYEGISNRVLWFAQHYLLRPTTQHFGQHTLTDWEQGYEAVNALVAEAVIDELKMQGCDASVLFQDYHLYRAPELVRQQCPQAQLTHFIHIPWPEARYWDLLPDVMARAIFRGLASNDVIGFQTVRDARNFLDGAARFLDDARIEPNADDPCGLGVLRWQERRIVARAYPIAVTPAEVHANADSRLAIAGAAIVREARTSDDHQLIVRVDRIEPTKNITRGFQAYELLLKEHAELRGKVTFLALLVPSRQGMAEYRAVEQATRRLIDRINARYGRDGWQPIIAHYGNDRDRALACMRHYDVLLVNPVIDGMNLVVKEGSLVNGRNGVIVLSRTAGAYEQLQKHALGVPPTDVRATMQALHQALTMSPQERAERADGLRAIVEAEDATSWLNRQLADTQSLVRSQRRRATIAQTAERAGSGRAARIPVATPEPVVIVSPQRASRPLQPVPALPAASAWRFTARMAAHSFAGAELAEVRDHTSLDGLAGLEELA
ncbi:MAG: trehalose-6-phosphate synthase [Ktedonobacterales bacterium]